MNERCKVSFSIGKYNDEVYYDVVDMDGCHIYLDILDNMMWMLNTLVGVICINWKKGE